MPIDWLLRNSGTIRTGVLILAWLPGLCLYASADEDALEQADALRYEDPRAALALLDERIGDAEIGARQGELVGLVNLRAQIRRDLGRLAEAADDAERFLELAEAADDPLVIARALYLGGTIQAERNDLAGALERFHEARRLFEEEDAGGELALVTNALGVVHNFIDDRRRARYYFESALELARAAGKDMLESSVLGNLALVISELDGPEAGLAVHREALALAERHGETGTVGYQMANLCERLVEVGRLDEAETMCGRALEQVEKLGHARVIAGAHMSLGDLHREQGRLEAARAHYQHALELADGQVSTVEQPVLKKLAELHERLGDPAAALGYYRRLMAAREAALERERGSLVEELEIRYLVGQQEGQIEFLQLRAELQATRLRQRNLMLAAVLVALVLCTALAVVAWRGNHGKSVLQRQLVGRNRELLKALKIISRLARTDLLTGLPNRRSFLVSAREELVRRRASGSPLTLAIADLDRFKRLNDRHGHPVGDQVLAKVAARLKEVLREGDIVCRWGGEEFMLLLPDTSLEAARNIVERVRADLAARLIDTEAGSIRITLTFGLAPVEDDLEAAIRVADQSMYEGKRSGRDRVVGRPEAPETRFGNVAIA